MTRWFRFYDDAVNDPKVQRLDPKLFKAWVNILCLASKNAGWLPSIDDLAFSLRTSEDDAGQIVDGLISSGLLDEIDGKCCPHNWHERQYKSDSSAERMKRHRDKRRDVEPVTTSDVTSDVTVTVQNRAETEQIQNSVAIATGADAPDSRTRLFKEGLAKLAALTGKGPDSCRAFVGKCLKEAGDDAIVVLGLIEDAERNQVVNASAWIAARLKSGEPNARPRSAIIQASDDLRRKIASFSGPAGGAERVRGGEGEAPARLLSHGRRE